LSLTLNQPEPLDTVLSRLASDPAAWVRLAAAHYDDSWDVEVCDIVTGAPPISWTPERLMYRDAVFVALRTKGTTVVRWLKRRKARLSGITLSFPELHPNPQVQRDESKAKTFYETALWPTIRSDLILSSATTNRQQPQQMLVADGMHTFQNFATAARYLLHDNPAVDSVIQRRISYRHQDTSARIALVEYTDDDVWAYIEGDGLPGVTVEVMAHIPGPSKKLVRAPKRPVHLKLPEQVMRNAFVALVRGDQCLDQKPLGWEWPVMQDPDVRRLVKFDPAGRLKTLLWHKENDQVEFKGGTIGESDSDKEAVMKTVAAYANGDGGSIFFGINKRYEVLGLREEEVPAFEDTVSDMIDDWVHPAPSWNFDIVEIPGSRTRVVVELIVQPGAWLPYAIGTTRKNLRYYVRHYARSVPARQDEVRALARSRPPTEPPSALSILQ
jgi:hypothetical protein